MALMVEAAEQPKIFQWMTPSDRWRYVMTRRSRSPLPMRLPMCSCTCCGEATRVWMAQAVENKLRKNAVKHPACVGVQLVIRAQDRLLQSVIARSQAIRFFVALPIARLLAPAAAGRLDPHYRRPAGYAGHP